MINNKRIIPTVFSLQEKEGKQLIEKLEPFKHIHLDFMDGTFTARKSIPLTVLLEASNTIQELHLMVRNPLEYGSVIEKSQVSKVLIHVDVYDVDHMHECITHFKQQGLSVFIVLNPDVDDSIVQEFSSQVNGVMCMTVFPGKQGQSFIEESAQKARRIKKEYPHLTVQIDGGVNDKTLKTAIECNVDLFAVGSFIGKDESPEKAYKKLEKKL